MACEKVAKAQNSVVVLIKKRKELDCQWSDWQVQIGAELLDIHFSVGLVCKLAVVFQQVVNIFVLYTEHLFERVKLDETGLEAHPKFSGLDHESAVFERMFGCFNFEMAIYEKNRLKIRPSDY